LLKINLDFLFRKTGASLNFKIKLGSLHISPEAGGQGHKGVPDKSTNVYASFSAFKNSNLQ
jgi:hypothetical protein